MSSHIEQMSEYLHEITFNSIPHEAVRAAKFLIADQIGLCVRGNLRKSISDYLNPVVSLGGKEESSAYGLIANNMNASAKKLPCEQAAFANTLLGSAYGFEAIHSKSGLFHISAVVVPPALAAAEMEDASGRDVIAATVAATDIITRISYAMSLGGMYDRGFEPTSLLAVFGSAAGASKLMGLSRDQIKSAFGLAAGFGTGLIATRGYPAFFLRLGHAVRSGVFAAIEARAGCPAPSVILEGENGFCNVYSPRKASPEELSQDLGRRFEITGIGIKKYCTGIFIFSALDALLQIMKEHKIKGEEIHNITVSLQPSSVHMVGSETYPKWNESLFNARYVLAVASKVGEEGVVFEPEAFTDRLIDDPFVRSLFNRINIIADAELDKKEGFPKKLPCIVEVTTSGGQKFSLLQDKPAKGEASNPFSEEEMLAKFVRMCAPILGEEKSIEIGKSVLNLENVSNIKELIEPLCSVSGPR